MASVRSITRKRSGRAYTNIHFPREPRVEEILTLLQRATDLIPPARLLVNPDCGLKTQRWAETEAALRNMVEAARCMREQLRSTAKIKGN